MAERVVSLPPARRPLARALVPTPRAFAIGAAMVAASALAYLAARETSLFAVTQIEVTGASPAVGAEAERALRFVRGRSLLKLDGKGVVAALERLPPVLGATYDRDFPHTLRVRIVPERPVAVLRRGADAWLVSARGRVTAAVPRRRLRALPRIWLRPSALVRLGGTVRDPAGSLASRALASFRGAGLGGRISYVRADAGRIVVGMKTGLQVRMGAPVDIPLKLAVVRSILPTLAEPGAGGPTYLDVAAPERPVAGTNAQLED